MHTNIMHIRKMKYFYHLKCLLFGFQAQRDKSRNTFNAVLAPHLQKF